MMIKISDKPAIAQLGMFLDPYSGAYVTPTCGTVPTAANLPRTFAA